MAEKVAKLALVHELEVGYFVNQGAVWKALWVAYRPTLEKVHDLGLSQDPRYFYFLDDRGDASRVPRGKGDPAEVDAMAEGVACCLTNKLLSGCCRERNLRPDTGSNLVLARRLLSDSVDLKGLREILRQRGMEDLRDMAGQVGVSAEGRKDAVVEMLVEAIKSGQAGAVAVARKAASVHRYRDRQLLDDGEEAPGQQQQHDGADAERYEVSWEEEVEISTRIREVENVPPETLYGSDHAKLLALDPAAARRIGGTDRLAHALRTVFEAPTLCGLSLTSFRFQLEFVRLSGLLQLVESKRLEPKEIRVMLRPPDGCDLDTAYWLQRQVREDKLSAREFPCIDDRRMHVKLLVAKFQDGSDLAIIGSSNSTRAGIASNEEFNVAFTCRGDHLGEPMRWFEKAWQNGGTFDFHDFNFDVPPPRVRRPLFLFQRRAAQLLEQRLGPLLHGVPRPGNRNSLGGYGGGLLVMPTGAGKTLTAMRWIVSKVLPYRPTDREWRRVLWLTHRRELLDQAADTARREIAVARCTELKMLSLGDIEGPMGQTDLDGCDLVFMTAGRAHSLVRELAPERPRGFDLIVIDEAHRASMSGRQYREVLTAIPHSARLGLTATPYRGQSDDKPNFANVFRRPEDRDDRATFLVHYTVEDIEREPLPGGAQLFAELEPIQIQTKFRRVIRASNEVEFVQNLSMFDEESRNRVIVDAWFKHAKGLGPSIVFCASREHANTLAGLINRRRGRAQAFHEGETTKEATKHLPLATSCMNSFERGLILERFRGGYLEVLCCVELLTEGFDLPGIGAILLARPTMSTLLLMQMIGRGRRGPAVGGLRKVKIIDFADQLEIHSDRHDAEQGHVARVADAEQAWRNLAVGGEDAREGE